MLARQTILTLARLPFVLVAASTLGSLPACDEPFPQKPVYQYGDFGSEVFAAWPKGLALFATGGGGAATMRGRGGVVGVVGLDTVATPVSRLRRWWTSTSWLIRSGSSDSGPRPRFRVTVICSAKPPRR